MNGATIDGATIDGATIDGATINGAAMNYLSRSIFLLALTVLTVVWSACSGPINAPASGVELCTVKSLDFCPFIAGGPMIREAFIASCGTDTLRIDSIRIRPSSFTSLGVIKLKIEPQDTTFFEILFNPVDTGSPQMGTCDIYSNVGTISISLSGCGNAANNNSIINVPSTIDFDTARINVCEDSLLGLPNETTAWISNKGNDTLRITSVKASSPFSILTPQSITIRPQDSSQIRLRFCPMVTGTVTNGKLDIVSKTSGADVQTSVTLKGVGVTYIPKAVKGKDSSGWFEINTLTDNTVKVVRDSSSILRITANIIDTSADPIDLSYSISVSDTLRPKFLASDLLLIDDSVLQLVQQWLSLPIRKNGDSATYVKKMMQRTTIHDSVYFLKDSTWKFAGSQQIPVHKIGWRRWVTTILAQKTFLTYRKDVVMAYSTHLGMIFIEETNNVLEEKSASRKVTSYRFR